jgi:aminotransferase/cystathionine beta-lyase
VSSDLIVQDGRYVIDFDDFGRKAKEPGNKLLLFCSPHNPVGRVWEREELVRVGNICLENGVTVLSDEIHFDIVLPGYTHTVFAEINRDFAENTLTCTAPSKTFNLAGLQTSNIIIKNRTLRHLYAKKLAGNGGSMLNIFGYRACETAYTACEEWLGELLVRVDENRVFAEEFVKNRLQGIKVYRLEGTYLQWWDCRGLGLEGDLDSFMDREALLFPSPGRVFGAGGKEHERVNLACPASVLEAALERLAAALERRRRMK